MGSNLALTTNTFSYEGGMLGDIIIRNNVFVNSANHPGAVTIPISQMPELYDTFQTGNISVVDNVFIRCGTMFSVANISSLEFTNNIMIDPLVYGQKVITFKKLIGDPASADTLSIKNNRLFGLGFEKNKTASNTTHAIDAELASKIYEFCDHGAYSATEMISFISSKLDKYLDQ